MNSTGQYYFNDRWYAPNLGRFTTEDPIRSGLNWFIYANNNPLRFVDPTGLREIVSDGLYYIPQTDTLMDDHGLAKDNVSVKIEKDYYEGVSVDASQEKYYQERTSLVHTNPVTGEETLIFETQSQGVPDWFVDEPGLKTEEMDPTNSGLTVTGEYWVSSGSGGALIKSNPSDGNVLQHGSPAAWSDKGAAERWKKAGFSDPTNRDIWVGKPYSAGCNIPITGSEMARFDSAAQMFGLKGGDPLKFNYNMSPQGMNIHASHYQNPNKFNFTKKNGLTFLEE